MVMSVEIPRKVYDGNGSTKAWPLTFTIEAETDVRVFLTDANDVQTEILTNFSVDLDTEEVTYPVSGDAIATGNKVTLLRSTPKDQQLSLSDQGAFSSKNIMLALDKCVRVIQELQEALDRAILYPVSSTPDTYDPTAVLEAGTAAASSAVAALASQVAASASAVAAAASAESMTPASQADAEAGTDNSKYLTSLRGKQAIVALTKRVTTIVSHATPSVNTDNCDAVTITALGEAITSMTTNLTGSPINFQKLIFRIKDDGTGRAITWGAKFIAKGVDLPTTTVANKLLTVGFEYDTVTAKWGCIALALED